MKNCNNAIFPRNSKNVKDIAVQCYLGTSSYKSTTWNVSSMDNGPRVEYDPTKMWFDYQALFDKTKSIFLGQPCDIEVKHTNCYEYEYPLDKVRLNQILSGDIDAQCNLVNEMKKYINDRIFLNEYLSSEIVSNYIYLMCIAISLCDLSDEYGIRHDCEEKIGYLPKELSWRDVNKICYYDAVTTMFKYEYSLLSCRY